MEEQQIVVVDNGSGWMKGGFAGEEAPRAVFPSCVGRYKNVIFMVGHAVKSVFVGDEAIAKGGAVTLAYPIEECVMNWDNMEKIWTHMFSNELRVAPEEQPLLLTEPPLNPLANREKMTQIAFETYNVPAFAGALQQTLALRTLGRTSGLVIDLGESSKRIVPIYEGRAVEKGLTRFEKLKSDFARDLIAKFCNVALDFDSAVASAPVKDYYYFPEDKEIHLSTECFQVPEALFRPTLLGREVPGLHTATYNSIMGCDSMSDSLFSNIVLAGGSSMLPGLAERLTKELSSMTASKVEVVAAPDRKYAAWLGGSQLASSADFNKILISKEEYDEFGPSIIHTKCPL